MAVVAPETRPQERTPSPSPPRRELRRRRRRPLTERLTLNVVVGLVAALLAFVLAASLLADRREMITVAVARDRIPAGTAITPEMLQSEELPADTEFADTLVPFDSPGLETSVATRTIQAGEPLTGSAIGASGSVTGQRVMSISLESWQAANGELQVGDQIDVIEATRDGSRYVLTNAAVVGRSGGGESGGLVGGTRSGELVILVEVDSAEALELAAAIEAGTIMVVRSTGAAPVTDTAEAGG
jgi:Flp pilus assembly protein CpaB